MDPLTGLTPTDDRVELGFLLINDTITRRGEGFVNFTIQPNSSAVTGDSIYADAEIVFDMKSSCVTLPHLGGSHPVDTRYRA